MASSKHNNKRTNAGDARRKGLKPSKHKGISGLGIIDDPWYYYDESANQSYRDYEDIQKFIAGKDGRLE